MCKWNTRQAVIDDAQALHDLHTRSVRELCAPYYGESVIDGWLAGRNASIYLPGISAGSMDVVESNDKLLGFSEAIHGEILAVYVAPESVRRGVGARLLEKALERAARDCSCVRLKASLNAVGFYQRFGFKPIGPSAYRRNDVDIPVVAMERVSMKF